MRRRDSHHDGHRGRTNRDRDPVDGSPEMLAKAEECFRSRPGTNFVRASFQEMLAHDPLATTYDFIASSLAIHHLNLDEKSALYRYIHQHLAPGGHFVNIDVTLAPSARLEQWYLDLWRAWITERAQTLNLPAENYVGIVNEYKANRDNQPDRLEEQLVVLRQLGFTEVDCYYKYGLFTIFGGGRSR